jgi:hypothetical protein
MKLIIREYDKKCCKESLKIKMVNNRFVMYENIIVRMEKE